MSGADVACVCVRCAGVRACVCVCSADKEQSLPRLGDKYASGRRQRAALEGFVDDFSGRVRRGLLAGKGDHLRLRQRSKGAGRHSDRVAEVLPRNTGAKLSELSDALTARTLVLLLLLLSCFGRFCFCTRRVSA